MNTTKDEYASHMTDIGDTTLEFLSKSGMAGWPTILGILNNMVINPDTVQWFSKSGIEEKLPVPELGDSVHWYKTKFDLKSNFRRSVPLSLLKDVNMFTSNDIPEPINSCEKMLVSKTATYFSLQTNTKVCSKNELDLGNCKDLEMTGCIDVITKDNFDYVLTPSEIYRLDNTSFEGLTKIFENHGTLVSFCLANSVIIVAGSEGGYKIDNISGNPSITKIKREIGSYTPPAESSGSSGSSGDGSAEATPQPISFDNGVPTGACTYCWYDGSKYYIGDYTTSGHFSPSASSFVTTYEEGIEHPSFVTSGVNRNHNGVGYIEKGGTMYGNTLYSVTDVKSVLELDTVMIFGTGSGLKVFTKTAVDGGYGPTAEYLSLGGISEPVNSICALYGTVFVIGQNNKFRSFDSEEDDNKLRIILFGTDYDVDIEADETDAKEVKLTLMELLDLGGTNSKSYESKLSKAKSKKAEYAIAVYDNKPKVFNLYGHDNRNAAAIELKACMTSFDMEV